MRERRKAVGRLDSPVGRVIEVSVGTGTNLPLLAERLGDSSRLAGIDISRAMLERAKEKAARHGIAADLIECEAAHLPFADATFDAVFHHGGFAEFGHKRRADRRLRRVPARRPEAASDEPPAAPRAARVRGSPAPGSRSAQRNAFVAPRRRVVPDRVR
jgi:ubiquinone/menaquinone biosynthesis C-methylase UbiE